MPNILQDATTTMHKEVYSDDQGGVLFHLNVSFYLPEKDCVDPFSKVPVWCFNIESGGWMCCV